MKADYNFNRILFVFLKISSPFLPPIETLLIQCTTHINMLYLVTTSTFMFDKAQSDLPN